MRDNIKPIEAGFFKYCMKNLSHENTGAYEYVQIRKGRSMWGLMSEYSNANNISFKVLYNIVNKWDGRIFEWVSDVSGDFYPYRFPLEYIMLIPRRVMRKVPAFGMLTTTDKANDYTLAFIFKTKANGLSDINAINETRVDYWSDAYNGNKYSKALLYVNKIIDGDIPYSGSFLIAYVTYVMNCYKISIFRDDANMINYTICTLKKYVKFAKENKKAKMDVLKYVNGSFISSVNNFIKDIFEEINCK